MPRNRRGRMAAVLTALVLGAAACGGDDGVGAERSASDETTSSTSTSTTVPPGPFAPFTGEEVEDRPEMVDQPAMVVKVSNNDGRSLAALIGIDVADVIIEERIEDRATRFFVIFHSEFPDVVGPVRSGRTSDVELLANLGAPVMVLSGAHGSVMGQLNRLASDGEVVLVVDDARGIWHYRDHAFDPPDNLFSDPPAILEAFGERAGAPEPIFEYLEPRESRPPGDIGLGATVTGRDVVSFVFVPGEGYVRVQDGEVHVTREGARLAVDNVVLMETTYTPSQLVSGSVDAHTVGSGPATILIAGELWQGTWERPDRVADYTFRDIDGEEIALDPGQTWLSLVPAGTYELDVDPEIAEVARTVNPEITEVARTVDG